MSLVKESDISYNTIALTGAKRPNKFQHHSTPVHKVSSMKTCFAEVGVEELERPAQSSDLYLTEHLWEELGSWTSLPDINTLSC